MLKKKEEKKEERPVGEDMGDSVVPHDRYSRTISLIKNAVNGVRPKACVSVQVLDEIPNKYLPSSVAEFLYGLRDREAKEKDETLKKGLKGEAIVEISADKIELQSDREKRDALKVPPFKENEVKQELAVKKFKENQKAA